MGKKEGHEELNLHFGEHLRELMNGKNKTGEKLSYTALAVALSKAHPREGSRSAFSPQYLNLIARGETKPSIDVLEALASHYGENIERLRCIAGLPSNKVLKALAREPEKYLAMMIPDQQKAQIAVVSVPWAAHVLMTEEITEPNQYPTEFECKLRITGRGATEMLLNNEAQFAVVTDAALRRAEQRMGEDIEPLIDFTMSSYKSIYYLYRLKEPVKQEANGSLQYGALSATGAEDLAKEYAQKNNLLLPEMYDRLDKLVTDLQTGKIAGFHGWPFLNLYVESRLCDKDKIPFEKNHRWELEVKDEHPSDGRVALRLVAKKSFLRSDSSIRILRDLVGKLLQGRERINNAENRTEFLYDLLSRKLRTKETGLPYINKQAVEKFLATNICDVNISSATLERLRQSWEQDLRREISVGKT